MKIEMEITEIQAKYLRRKLWKWARQKKSQCRKDNYNWEKSQYFEEYVMLLSLEQEISKNLGDV